MPKLPFADCETCPARNGTLVPPEPASRPLARRLAIVGESPGYNEVSERRPFSPNGQSGRLLARLLRPLDRSQYHLTNAVPCDVAEKHLAEARKHCAKRLQRELAEVGAGVIVPVGKWALPSVLGTGRVPKILKWRGSVIRLGLNGDPSGKHGRPEGAIVCPTVHPAFALRSPEWESVLKIDIARVKRIVRDGYDPIDDTRFDVVRTDGDGFQHLESFDMRADELVSADVETDVEHPLLCRMACFGMSDGRNTVVVEVPEVSSSSWESVRGATKNVLGRRVVLTHNGPAFDHIVLARYGIELAGPDQRWEDSLLAQHVVAGHLPKRLQHVVTLHLDVPPWKEEHADDPATLLRYNARDVIYTARAWPHVLRELRAGGDKLLALYENEKINSQLCREMTVNGFAFDSARAAEFRAELTKQIDIQQARCSTIVEHPINTRSHPQLRCAFFDELKAPVIFRRKKTRSPVLDKEALQAYAVGPFGEEVNDLAAAMLEIRSLEKIRGSYIDSVEVHDDGRQHPGWKVGRVVTGRFSSELMQLPRPENDPIIAHGGIRSLYSAAPGYRLVAFDASQLEFRIAAYLTGDETMIAACERGDGDIHSANAATIFGDAFSSLPKGVARSKLRNITKVVGFAGVLYFAEEATCHAKVLAMGVNVSLRQVTAALKKLKGAFGGYYRYCDESMREAIRTGYVTEPLSGRRRWVGHAPEMTKVGNFPVQAGASWLLNDRLPRITDALRPLGARLVGQVHDAGYYEVPVGYETEAIAIGDGIFRLPVTFPNGRVAVFPAEWHVGDRWSEL